MKRLIARHLDLMLLSGLSLIIMTLVPGPARAADLASGSAMWIHGSFVNLRAAPQNNANVLAQWPTNTKITLLAERGKWCEVKGPNNTHGFVICTYLGTSSLTLSDLSNANETDSARRAFWIAPSWGRLVAAGDALSKVLMSDKQRENEIKQQKVFRWPVPEFEAMKARLREGVKLQQVQEIESVVTSPTPNTLAGLPANALPKARMSLFKTHSEILLSPTVDQAAAMRGSNLALRKVLRGPMYQSNRLDDEWIDGAWDIGEATLSIEPATVAYSISTSGLLGASAISEAGVQPAGLQAGSDCGDVDIHRRITAWQPKAEQSLQGFQNVAKDKELITFFSSRNLVPDLVKLRSREFRMASTQADGTRVINKTVIYEIDLDNDAIPDIVIMTGQTPGQVSPFLNWLKILFNINGAWSLERDETEADCT